MAYRALNSRINESGIWDKAAALTDTSMGDTTISGIPITVDCVGHWGMNDDEIGTATVVDSYSSHNGTASANTATLNTTGIIDDGFDLAGSAYITIADHADYDFSGLPFSLTIWANTNYDFAGNYRVLFKKEDEWMMFVSIIAGKKYLCFQTTADGGGSAGTSLSTEIKTDGWHFFCVTYSGNGNGSGVTLYVDGVDRTVADAFTIDFVNDTHDITIGKSTSVNNYWGGKIDSAAIFSKELADNEVYQLYNNGDGTEDIDEALCPHYASTTIKDSRYISKYLKYNTQVKVGTNRYGYIVSDDLGDTRSVYWWDGTDKSTAAAFVNNTTAFNYGPAGLARPASSIIIGKNEFNATSKYGGRQEQGRYYYGFTYYDSARDVESLPSAIADYTLSSWDWNATYETCKFPIVSVLSETQTTPTGGSGRYDSNTKVRIYRSKRTYSAKSIANPPNELFFLGEIDYKLDVTGLSYDHTGGTVARKLSGSNGNFTDVAVGDFIYLYGSASSNVAAKVYKVQAIDAVNAAYVQLEDDGVLFADDTSIECSFMVMADYQHDKELVTKYEGRGSPPPAGVDCMSPFSNRMYYFVGNTVYWSSAGRPDEVAQKYTLTFNLSSADGETTQSSMEMVPLLSVNAYGEAKYEISELSGETVIAAYPIRNRLYIWTEQGTCGYLEGTYTTEGVRFYLLRKGIGIISEKTLAHTPHGLFGADREGMWQLDNKGEIYRISKGVIDFNDSSKDTYIYQNSIHHSFGVWSAKLDEYIWCVANLGLSTYCFQIAFNPLRQVFSASYMYPALFGGCEVVTTSGVQNYLTNGKTFDTTSNEALAQTIEFWMGQGGIEYVKENVEIEVIYNSITADKNVTLNVYQNNVASTIGSMSFTGVVHNDDNLVGVVKPRGSGRMFLLSISIPSDCIAPIMAINYIAEFIPWNEKRLR